MAHIFWGRRKILRSPHTSLPRRRDPADLIDKAAPHLSACGQQIWWGEVQALNVEPLLDILVATAAAYDGNGHFKRVAGHIRSPCYSVLGRSRRTGAVQSLQLHRMCCKKPALSIADAHCDWYIAIALIYGGVLCCASLGDEVAPGEVRPRSLR